MSVCLADTSRVCADYALTTVECRCTNNDIDLSESPPVAAARSQEDPEASAKESQDGDAAALSLDAAVAPVSPWP